MRPNAGTPKEHLQGSVESLTLHSPIRRKRLLPPLDLFFGCIGVPHRDAVQHPVATYGLDPDLIARFLPYPSQTQAVHALRAAVRSRP